MTTRPTWLAVAILGLIAVTESPKAAECDPAITPSSDSQVAYKDRGNRCEGLFMRPIASSGLEIVGLHRNAIEDSTAGDSNEIFLSVIGGGPADLRAIATKPRFYYRMDGKSDVRGQFVWPRDVIDSADVDLDDRELAVLACVEQCGSPLPVLRPIEFGNDPPEQADDVEIVLMAQRSLAQVHISTWAPDGTVISHSRELLQGSILPAGKPLAIRLQFPVDADALRFEALTLSTDSRGDVDSVAALIKR